MNQGDTVLVFFGRGYRPAVVKEVGKRTVLVEWATGEQERVRLERVKEPSDIYAKSFYIRVFRQEKEIIELRGG